MAIDAFTASETKRLLDLAVADPYLGPIVLEKNLKDLVLFKDPNPRNKGCVGFCIPRQEKNGLWRTGPIFVQESHRKRGIAQKVIKEFFRNKKGMAFIDITNVPSQSAYAKAGFTKQPKLYKMKSGTYNVWINQEPSLESLNCWLNW